MHNYNNVHVGLTEKAPLYVFSPIYHYCRSGNVRELNFDVKIFLTTEDPEY